MWRIIVSLLVIELTLSNARIDCPGINEEYKECGRRCEKTCDNLNSIKSCSVECVSGCFCRPGTVRNQFYQCVPIPECRMPEGLRHIEADIKRCPKPNTEFKICGSLCKNTCDNPYATRTCSSGCVRGCFCKDGFVLDKHDECIPLGKCPIKDQQPNCTSNLEEYDQCGSPCPLTCDNYGTELECKKKCVPGCYCKQGLVRDSNGDCVLPAFCEITEIDFVENSQFEAANLSAICTGQNEVFKLAGGGQQTCNNRFYTLRPYTSTLALGCFCKTGYLRNYLGQCVLPENCPAIACPGRQQVFGCGPACDSTCSRLGQPCKKFSRTCVPRCYCMPGYARDHKNRCVRYEKCPLKCRNMSPFIQPYYWHPDFISNYKKITPTITPTPELEIRTTK